MQCGASGDSTNFDHSLDQAGQLAAYAANFTSGGDSCDGFVEVRNCHVHDCNRGLRVADSVKGGVISDCFVERVGQAGLYLSGSSYTGSTGCRNFTVSSNTVISAGNNSVLSIGGRDNTICGNVLKGGWNAAIQLWHCCQTTVSDNTIEKTNFSTWNGQGVDGDAWCAGIVAQGNTAIFGSATYQCRITNNVITEPSAGRAPAIYAIRIMNDAFSTGDVVFIQNNFSQGADLHLLNEGGDVRISSHGVRYGLTCSAAVCAHRVRKFNHQR